MFFCINNDLDNKDLEEEALDVDVTFAIILAVVVVFEISFAVSVAYCILCQS